MWNIRQERSRSEFQRQARHRPGVGVIFLCLATRVNSRLEDGQKRYFGCHQVGKKIYIIFIEIGYQRSASTGPYMDRRDRAQE